jgi:Ca2+-binding EF-hand superfamily protein
MFCIDGMIDANELSTVMNILKLPITDREANEMIEFADHDKGNSFTLSFNNLKVYFQKILCYPSMNFLLFSPKSLQ